MKAKTGAESSYKEVLDAALLQLDEQGAPNRDRLLELFPGGAQHIDRALQVLSSYDQFVDLNRAEQPARPGSEFLPAGTELDQYEIVGVLGDGGMGVVYRARQASLREREVALKVLRLSLVAQDPRFLERFRREAALASRVHDANVVEIYGYGEYEGQPYFTMQLIEGRSLSAVLKGLAQRQSNGWSEHTRGGYVRQAVRLVRDLASGLAAIHAAGLLHRDLKPSNVILAGAGEDDSAALCSRPMLVDFGLVREVDNSDLTGSLTRLGTAAFASPESQLGRKQDSRSDVFSLGAVLHDLLCVTGVGSRGPASSGLHSVRGRNSGVDERLDAIVAMALEERPELRYEDGGAFREELDRYLQSEPIRALPATQLGRLRLWGRRNPLRAVKAGVASVLLLVLLFLATWGGSQALPLYSTAAEARAAEREGDLSLASARYGELFALSELASWLPGLSDDLERSEEYWGLGGLSGLVEQLDSGVSSHRTLAHNELQRRLLEPGADSNPSRLMRFLVRELEVSDDQDRRLRAATTAGQYLLVFPLTFDEKGPRAEWAEGLELALLRVVREVEEGTPPGELHYQAICALSGLGQLEPFRQLIPLIAHADPETRRITTSATERIWLSSWKEDESTEFPFALLCEWAGAMWKSADTFEGQVNDYGSLSGRVELFNSQAHTRFAQRVGHSLTTVVWALRWKCLSPQVEESASWSELPSELREYLLIRKTCLDDHALGNASSEGGLTAQMTTWPQSGVPVTDSRPFNTCIVDPAVVFRRLKDAGEFVLFDNLWAPSDLEGDIHVWRNATGESVPGGRFLFCSSPPTLEGHAIELSVKQAYMSQVSPPALDNPPHDDGYVLLLRRPIEDQVMLRVQVPEWATRASFEVKCTPATRGPLPHLGSSRLRLRTKDNGFAVECDVAAVLGVGTTFLLNERALLGKNELELYLEVVSATNQFWLQTVAIDFSE